MCVLFVDLKPKEGRNGGLTSSKLNFSIDLSQMLNLQSLLFIPFDRQKQH